MAKIGYWDYITATDTYTWSDYIYHIYGLNPNDGIPPHKEAVKVCDKESLDKLLAATVELNTHGTPYNIVLKLINRNNEEVWVRNVAKPIYNKQNEIIGRRGVLQNITEWKEAQSELELSKEKIQSSLHLLEKRDHSLTESSRVAKIGHWEYDIATDTFVWSDYVYEIYGFEPSESIPSRKEIVAFYDKDSQLKLAKSTVDLTLKGTLYDIELKLINKKNKELWVRQVVHLVYNDKNEIIGRRGVVHNITAAKNAQIELEISKDEIQRSLELLEISEFSKNEASKMARIGYLEYDIATETFTWSEYIYHILGIDIKQPVPSRREIAEFFDKESNEKMRNATLKLDTEGVSFDIELKLTNLRKEEVWIRIAVEPVYDQQNKIIKRRGVLQDITASKNVQLELEFSKEKIQKSLKLLESSEFSKSEASKMAKMGYLEDDIATETYIWSEYIYHIFGFDIKQPVPSREKIAELFNEESQEKMRKATFRLDTEGVPFDIELKLTNLRNEEVWIRIAVEPVYDQQNRIIKRRGVLQNITASKKAQLELELSKEEIQTSLKLSRIRKNSMNEASKVAKIGYWEHDLLTDTVVWSEYVHRIFGSNSENGIPSELELLKKMNKESQEKFVEATASTYY
ncbi:PAS domain-containing protein [Polaribacter sejongensis]|uniref:PAS domain-containing protein n=1 Tax=Polaribacter sejongensis TaxID=985043 RepID=UPI0035A74733